MKNVWLELKNSKAAESNEEAKAWVAFFTTAFIFAELPVEVHTASTLAERAAKRRSLRDSLRAEARIVRDLRLDDASSANDRGADAAEIHALAIEAASEFVERSAIGDRTNGLLVGRNTGRGRERALALLFDIVRRLLMPKVSNSMIAAVINVAVLPKVLITTKNVQDWCASGENKH